MCTYSDPKNIAEYEEWKKQQDKEAKKKRKKEAKKQRRKERLYLKAKIRPQKGAGEPAPKHNET